MIKKVERAFRLKRLIDASVCASCRMEEALRLNAEEARGGDEAILRHYAKPQTRRTIVRLIGEAARHEREAAELIDKIVREIVQETDG